MTPPVLHPHQMLCLSGPEGFCWLTWQHTGYQDQLARLASCQVGVLGSESQRWVPGVSVSLAQSAHIRVVTANG